MPEPPPDAAAPELPPGLVVITAGQILRLGDIRRFVADMDAAGAGDECAVFAALAPAAHSQRPGDGDYPGGMSGLARIGGYPRSSRGHWPDPRP